MFPLRDHNDYNNKIDLCMRVVRSRVGYGQTLRDLLDNKDLVDLYGQDLIYLCFKAAEFL